VRQWIAPAPASTDSRKRDLICSGVLAGFSARLQCNRGFDFFQCPALAVHPHRHHCLTGLRGNKPTPLGMHI
jgi:hypothetical protein